MRLTIALLAGALAAQEITIVDVERVRADGDPAAALVKVTLPKQPQEIRCDMLVAGGSAGGVAAALRAAQRGHSVCLTEETGSLGGQFLSVPALDEHKFIEISGGTRSYYEVRNRIRDHYRRTYVLASAVAGLENFNPGSCYVSSLCFEPKVVEAVLQEMLKPHSGKIRALMRTKVIELEISGGAITSALAYRFDIREVIRIRPRFVLDATELGDLLPLAKTSYVVGSEAKAETQEPHAAPESNPACVQSFTYTFAVDHRPGENHRIPKPQGYEKIRDSQPFSTRMYYPVEFGWKGYVQYSMFGDDPPVPNNMSPRSFFSWRRLLARKNFEGEKAPDEVALMNWPRQDYHSESLLDRTVLDSARVLQAAKRVSTAFLYWLQTDVPRDEGAEKGYPELRLRKDIMGTEDGFSAYPYIRESRRLIAKARVVEQDLNIDSATENRSRFFPDSIGIGFYMVDIHPCGANERGRMMMPKPFQVPMGALIPRSGVTNLLAAGKNLGVTHMTNGAFRLHPIEWNVGESAAVLASMALRRAVPEASEVQRELAAAGVPLVWFDDLPVTHPAFAAIQFASVRELYPMSKEHLHASPDAPATRADAAVMLVRSFGHSVPKKDAFDIAVEKGWMAVDHRNWFHPDLPFYWTDWREDKFPAPLSGIRMKRTGPVTRAELARRITGY